MSGRRRGAAQGTTYREAGVDTDAKASLLEALAPTIGLTHSTAVAAGMGAFAGALRLPQGAGFLVATTDGVGTKTLLARRMGRDAVIGSDIVAHCANDLVCQGARPVAFLDYIAMGRLEPRVVEAVVGGAAEACRALGVPLLGGETAEMPGVYAGDAYDVVGTMIGVAPPDGLITGEAITPGDRLVGLASTGLHTNGYSLARRVLDERWDGGLDEPIAALASTLADALLAPHRCYAPAVLSLMHAAPPRGIAHITGGGIAGNLVRVLPRGRRARVVARWPRPPVFDWLAEAGGITEAEMFATFNMGIGMVLALPPPSVARAVEHFEASGIPAYEIGEVVGGDPAVELA